MFSTLRLRPVSRDELFGPLSRQLDRMLNDVFGQDFTDGVKSKANFPPLDACTTKDGRLVVKTAVAGYAPDQIDIQILPENILEISGSSKNNGEKTNGERTEDQYHIRELTYGSFKRQLRLPDNVEGEPVAELKDGILTLTFRLQLPEEKKPEVKKIPIQQG
jgi:HSP20 family molecular chaperone IbpA